jgi:hypothetical protein
VVSELHSEHRPTETSGAMNTYESTTLTFVVPTTFENALKAIRGVLTKGELSIPMEMDVSGRINRELGVRLPTSCRLLCVDSPSSLLHSIVLHGSPSVLLPLHLIVTARGPQTVVSLLSRSSIHDSGLPAAAKAPVSELQSQISLRQPD